MEVSGDPEGPVVQPRWYQLNRMLVGLTYALMSLPRIEQQLLCCDAVQTDRYHHARRWRHLLGAVLLGLHHSVNDILVLLGCYAAYIGS